mgnify:CR=1 FL=1
MYTTLNGNLFLKGSSNQYLGYIHISHYNYIHVIYNLKITNGTDGTTLPPQCCNIQSRQIQ